MLDVNDELFPPSPMSNDIARALLAESLYDRGRYFHEAEERYNLPSALSTYELPQKLLTLLEKAHVALLTPSVGATRTLHTVRDCTSLLATLGCSPAHQHAPG